MSRVKDRTCVVAVCNADLESPRMVALLAAAWADLDLFTLETHPAAGWAEDVTLFRVYGPSLPLASVGPVGLPLCDIEVTTDGGEFVSARLVERDKGRRSHRMLTPKRPFANERERRAVA